MKVRELKELIVEFTDEEIEKYFINNKVIDNFKDKIQVYNITKVLSFEEIEKNKYLLTCVVKL